jgi:hypothetical protein
VQGEDEPVFCLGPDYSSSEEIYSVSVVDLKPECFSGELGHTKGLALCVCYVCVQS